MESKNNERTGENILNRIKVDKCLDSELFLNTRNEVEIHFKFFDSIHITSKSLNSKDIRFKLSIDDLNQRDNESMNGFNCNQLSDLIEIAVMDENECLFQRQEPNGRLYNPKEFVLIRTKVTQIDEIAFRIDLHSSGSDSKRTAFSNIFGSHFKDTNGLISMPLNGENGKIVAKLHLEYLKMSPIKGFEEFDETVLVESWIARAKGYDVGHRGAGIARRTDRKENILENTIASFNFASLHGADMVELDVQLSKDKIPLVYHDFDVNIIMKKRKQSLNPELHPMPIKDLTYKQLQNLKLSPVIKANKSSYDFGDEDEKEENLPFASLEKVLESVDPKCGLNVEIKYPQQKSCGQWESEKTFDLNEYVDIILDTVWRHAGARNIMFSCFHPDICSLLKYKQNRFPVLFLTQGVTKKWPNYKDPRNGSIEMATYFAKSVALEGINVHSEDIINDRSLIQFVKSKNLVLFCWGEDLNRTELIDELKQEGVDGVVYDRIDILCGKAVSAL